MYILYSSDIDIFVQCIMYNLFIYIYAIQTIQTQIFKLCIVTILIHFFTIKRTNI